MMAGVCSGSCGGGGGGNTEDPPGAPAGGGGGGGGGAVAATGAAGAAAAADGGVAGSGGRAAPDAVPGTACHEFVVGLLCSFCLAFLFHALQVIEPAAGRACSSPCQASPLRAPVFLHGFGVSISRSASAPRASLRLRALLGLWLHDLSEHKRTADTHVGAQLERSTCE